MAMIRQLLLLLAGVLLSSHAKPVSDIGPIYTDLEYVVDSPETRAGLFQGDIELTTDSFRNALASRYYHWPRGVVPYTFDKSVADDPDKKRSITEAIEEMERVLSLNGKKCITFVPRTSQRTYIEYYVGIGCHSPVGYQHGKQRVSIGNGCYSKGIIQHETLHSLGFWHEHMRSDRDKFVTVNRENIYPGQMIQFNILSKYTTDNLGTKYDYGSVMHYGRYGFSKNGQPTLTPTDPNASIGQRRGMSPTDIFKVRTLYACNGKEYQPPTAPPGVLVDCPLDSDWCNFVKSHNGGTFELVNGPIGSITGDHTSGLGSYALYTTAAKENDYARLDILDIPATPNGYCISFWYYTNQVNPGLIRFWTRGEGIDILDDVRVDKPLSGWTEYKKFIPLDHTAKAALDIASNRLGVYIAIDDVKLVHGSC